MVFGTILREISTFDSLKWVPGFPIDERLNIFTAGCLLALMSVPTIFSLAEDALNNVPSAYAEASEALGASRLQTAFRVMVPAAFSGILAAVLLGLGRVIGETMVVLLVAGNRIKIPDFSEGIGAFFQPSHTLTGIIAQELGEVPLGSVHYRALFVIGITLFVVVLGVNGGGRVVGLAGVVGPPGDARQHRRGAVVIVRVVELGLVDAEVGGQRGLGRGQLGGIGGAAGPGAVALLDGGEGGGQQVVVDVDREAGPSGGRAAGRRGGGGAGQGASEGARGTAVGA
jgi:hypothetical protein